VASFFEPSGNVGSKNEKIYGGVPSVTLLVEEDGRWTFVEALVGKGHETKK
jgi:hypothetical protein